MARGTSKIRLYDRDVFPAATEGPANVFSSTPFLLVKSRWIADDAAQVCPLCLQKFTQIRRKHHCRQCGRVLCSKCCNEKVPLPQLGFEEPERICNNCLEVTSLVTKSRSLQMSFKLEAAKGLSELCKDPAGLTKVVEMGGVQTLIFLSQSGNDEVKAAVASGLQILSTHPPLHSMLAKCGGIKALCSILSTVNESQEQTLIYGISALMIFCKRSPELKAQALADGALDSVLTVCAMKEALALLALMTLSYIVEHQGNLAPGLIESNRNALPRILALTKAQDEKIQEISLRILAQMSVGTDWQRHCIVQEDFSAGRCLVEALTKGPKNLQVLVNASCLIANLATGDQDQMSLQDCLQAMCSLTSSHTAHKDIQTHVSRGLGNFAKFHQNSSILIDYLPSIVETHLKSTDNAIKCHGLRTVMYLISYQKERAVDVLLREGAHEVLTSLGTFNGIVDAVETCLLKIVPTRSDCTITK
ncbi:unnamed protein product [Porites evermanni]|uniref:FYVE-type domain-containing protein n=1 Tax=Porites evermanni TaxID=104178 RepID=A0ABN8LMT9_9CNID|nr:unnamed protein product [Porites evermanni]